MNWLNINHFIYLFFKNSPLVFIFACQVWNEKCLYLFIHNRFHVGDLGCFFILWHFILQ